MVYHVTKRFDSGLVGLNHRRHGDQIWALCKTRKHFVCAMAGTSHLKGEMAFRPIGNAMNRSARISEEAMNKRKTL